MADLTCACILRPEGTYRISVDGKIIPFDWAEYLGPCPVTKTGAERQLGPRHKFWVAVSQWAQQGKQFDNDGLCIWYHEPEPILEHIVGKHYMYRGDKPAVKGS